ncbi:MAG: hypothetical protein QY332_16035 [Anaerolineales bacterium]|nr:MAG: hypothetical protein QY332_16035 [Anaerolineales bacterium]
MKFELHWLNGLWLMLPLLAWNIVLAPKITLEQVVSDANSPAWLLTAESITRIIVFVFPILLALQFRDVLGKAGLVIYVFGTLIYFASWIPLIWMPASDWSASPLGLLAPRLTPLLPFLGIALIGHSAPYVVFSVIFVALHTWHGIQNLTF